MKTVLITGVGGFIGRNVAREATRNGWRVVGIDIIQPENVVQGSVNAYHHLTLPDPRLADILDHEKPVACIHCAGRASVPLSVTDPAGDFEASVHVTFALLDAIRRSHASTRFVLLSSAAVYGNPAELPIAENHAIRPISPYGFHKHMAENLCREFSQLFGLSTVVARIFSAYGPGLRRQVLWDICYQIFTTGKVTLRGTGKESRDFIHVRDVAQALLMLAESESPAATADVVNVSTGVETTIATLARLLVQASQCDAPITFDGSVDPGMPINWRADVNRLTQRGFAPSETIESGVSGFARWAREELLCR